jgi:hypothetical protein
MLPRVAYAECSGPVDAGFGGESGIFGVRSRKHGVGVLRWQPRASIRVLPLRLPPCREVRLGAKVFPTCVAVMPLVCAKG